MYYKKWNSYCTNNGLDIYSVSVNQVVEFFTELFPESLSSSALNTARSALSSLVVGVLCLL